MRDYCCLWFEFHVTEFLYVALCSVTNLLVESTTRNERSISQTLTSDYVVMYFSIPTQSRDVNTALGKNRREVSQRVVMNRAAQCCRIVWSDVYRDTGSSLPVHNCSCLPLAWCPVCCSCSLKDTIMCPELEKAVARIFIATCVTQLAIRHVAGVTYFLRAYVKAHGQICRDNLLDWQALC